jgi:hypothetical protein
MPTSETIETIPIRVSGARVTLDPILAFNAGASAEEIAEQYPVPLADIYRLIGYALRHTVEMATYLARRRRESHEVRRQNEARWSPGGVRQRLLDQLLETP